MLDVHPPHHPTHGWRDFFIHIATIVVGLLIAVGLEQTVEFFHHRHQRKTLEASIRAETEDNVQILTTHLDVNIPNMLWYRRVLEEVRTAPIVTGFADLTVPPTDPAAPRRNMISPERSVWPSAVATGQAELLSDDEAEAYATVDKQFEMDEREVNLIRDASARVTRWQLQSGQRIVAGAHLHITPDQRRDLIEALSYHCQQLFDLLRRDNIYLTTLQLALAGDYHDIYKMNPGQSKPLRVDAYR
jgi:hypothetical protein